MHGDLELHREKLEQEGIHFDYATLAVRSSDDESGKGCRYCGLCLYGCPYDSIFSAASQLEQMVRKGQIAYQSNILVDRISTNGSGVRIEGRSSSDNAPCSFDGQRAFLATGVLESARIVLNSTNRRTVRLRVQQSDIFTIPILRYRSTPDIERERINTLCQTVVDIDDPSICTRSVQLQLYGYNDLYSQILARRSGAFARPLAPVLRAVSARLLVAFGYLHSDVSSPIWLTRTDSSNGRLRLEGQTTQERKRVGDAVVGKFFRMRSYFQAVPIPQQLRFDDPGGSHRSGGCFPMRKAPEELETDEWGNIPELPGLHVVDASVLPSVPARPMAFTVMANAHRIASECPIPHA
jgi:ferredoxin